MNRRIAKKIVKDRILPAPALYVATGGGIGINNACYTDRERKAARVFTRCRVSRIVRSVKDQTGGCIEASRRRVRAKITEASLVKIVEQQEN